MPTNGTRLDLRSVTGIRLSRDTAIDSKYLNTTHQDSLRSCPCPNQNQDQEPQGCTQTTSDIAQRIFAIEEMVERHSSGLPGSTSAKANHKILYSTFTVLLTGTTGNLGSEVLSLLLTHNSVDKVYAFNRRSSRKSSLVEHHAEKFRSKGLDLNLLQSTKLVFIEGDTTENHFGLDVTLYEQIRTSVTMIIHNAWPINVVKPMKSFEPNLHGLRHLIDMSLSSPHRASIRFLFISSMAAAQSWNWKMGPVPEEVIHDASLAIGNGYGESKFIAERILSNSGLRASTLRVGQICGSFSNGAWSPREWVPILVKSSLALGALPEAEGVVSWLPMDIVAETVVEIALTKKELPSTLNILHSQPTKWNVLMRAIANAILPSNRPSFNSLPLPIIPFQDWFYLLEGRAQNINHDDIKNIPGVKLLEIYRGMAVAEDAILKAKRKNVENLGFHTFATDMARCFSPTLSRVRSLTSEDAEQWVAHWKALGFIDSGNGVVQSRL